MKNSNNLLTELNGYAVNLTLVNDTTQALLLAWRNQAEIRHAMANQAEISPEEHLKWYVAIKQSECEKHYIIWYKAQAIGAINIKSSDQENLYHCQQAEIGLYIAEEKYRNNIISFSPSLLLNDLAFQTLKIQQLSSKVRADNQAALKYNQQLGYQLEPPKNNFVVINLIADDYNNASKTIKSLLNRGSRNVDRKT